MPDIRYGVASPAEIAHRTGKEFLQAIIDGELPHPSISETMSIWIREVADGGVRVASIARGRVASPGTGRGSTSG